MSLATLYCLFFLCACVICLPAVKGTRVCGLLYPETETRLKIPRLQVSYNVACIASRIVCTKFEWQSHEGNSQEGSGEKQFIVAVPRQNFTFAYNTASCTGYTSATKSDVSCKMSTSWSHVHPSKFTSMSLHSFTIQVNMHSQGYSPKKPIPKYVFFLLVSLYLL